MSCHRWTAQMPCLRSCTAKITKALMRMRCPRNSTPRGAAPDGQNLRDAVPLHDSRSRRAATAFRLRIEKPLVENGKKPDTPKHAGVTRCSSYLSKGSTPPGVARPEQRVSYSRLFRRTCCISCRSRCEPRCSSDIRRKGHLHSLASLPCRAGSGCRWSSSSPSR